MVNTPPHESSGDESGEQQLFGESLPSPKTLAVAQPQSAITSAIRSASLLNAVRVVKYRAASGPIQQASREKGAASSPTIMTTKASASGKLKRPSFAGEDLEISGRRKLAPRGDVFDLQPSPDKSTLESPFKLSEVVNRRPLRIKKKKKNTAHATTTIKPKLLAASSPPKPAPSLDNQDEDALKIPETDPLQSSPPPTLEGDNAQKIKKARKKHRRRSERITAMELNTNPMGSADTISSHPRPTAAPKRKALGQPPRNRVSKSPRRESDVASAATKAARYMRRQPMVVIPNRNRAQLEKNNLATHETSSTETAAGTVMDNKKATSRASKTNRSKAANPPTNSRIESRPGRKFKSAHAQGSTVECDSLSVQSDKEINKTGVDPNTAEGNPLDRVFEFLHHGPKGKCETLEGACIVRDCRTAGRMLQNDDPTYTQVADATSALGESLVDYGSDEGHSFAELAKLKADAYRFLFRSLVSYFSTLNNWLERYDEESESTEAMRIMSPFVSCILRLKDDIAAWKVALPMEHQGEGITKNVETKLIAPLRRLATTYRSTLKEREATAQARSNRELMMQKRRKEDEQRARRAENEVTRQRRWGKVASSSSVSPEL